MKVAFKCYIKRCYCSPNSNSHIPHSNIGFTIVELLVVIVVIGILAAITIVSYTGISGRAINSSVKSDISQAYKQLEISKTTSSTDAYPVDQASANLKSSNGTTYTYYSDSPYKSYCLVATNSSTVYSVSSSNPIPLSGNCLSNGLVLSLDAGNTASYPGSGTTWTDLSGLGNNGTLVNGVGYSSGNGGSLTFDGVDDYVNLLNSGAFNSQNLTLGIWVKPAAIQPNAWNSLLDYSHGYGSVCNFVIQQNELNTNQYWFAYRSTSSNWEATTAVILSANVWQYLMVSKENTSVKIYVNGIILVNFSTTNGNILYNTSRRFTIGGSASSDTTLSRWFNGSIGDARIFNRALSSSEITQNFNTLKGRYGL
jgi:prepilin-type N-terminal cleavage/methylation domain-containing protein